MVFSSTVFLFYFLPIFLVGYMVAGKRLKNVVALIGSILFYAWGAPKFVFVILGTTVIDFFLVRKMDEAGSKKQRMALLVLSCCMNLGLLFYFKYSNFFVENINGVLGMLGWRTIPWLKLALPIGISFYTFETLTYVVDVYRGVHKPLKNFWDYQLYIILFPKLIAGPIIRFHDIADQLYDRQAFEGAEYKLKGFYRFITGLAKKVIIANTLGAAADVIFKANPHDVGTLTAWWGILSYTFQIYFDFSGYSDMAIGLALMMGFRFPENFNNPYSATSITDFWRRWHISLGSWMRNYLYIPLGGNQQGTNRTYFNLWIVFLASGLWHGAAWGFIIWGAYHGFFLVAERVFLGRFLKKAGIFSVLYTFIVVLIGWVFFRLEHLRPALQFFSRMFVWHPGTAVWQPDAEFYTMTCLAFLFSFFTLLPRGIQMQEQYFFGKYSTARHVVTTVGLLLLFWVAAARVNTSHFNPFIYFRF